MTTMHDRGEEPRGRIFIACGMISSSNVSGFRAVTSTVAICNDGVDGARTASGSMKGRAKTVVVGATV